MRLFVKLSMIGGLAGWALRKSNQMEHTLERFPFSWLPNM